MAEKSDNTGKVVPLAALSPWEKGIILRLPEDWLLVRRLAACGLLPGVEVMVHRRTPAYIVQAGAVRIALDRRTAAGIMVLSGGEQ
ncbi:MAG: ferrous iron transport protein A [Firmicutes bacterium]|nr:ferrous iron transport protein A [Bacillota bacterium]